MVSVFIVDSNALVIGEQTIEKCWAQVSKETRVWGYVLDNQGSVPVSDNDGNISSSPLYPDQLWGLPSLL